METVVVLIKKLLNIDLINVLYQQNDRSNVMTKARIQPFCRANNTNLG